MKPGKFRKGQVAIVMTLAIATLLGVMALGADVGVMYYNHIQLQKGADAAALAGGSFLYSGVTFANANGNCAGDDAHLAACTYAINNNLAYDANSLTITKNAAGMPAPNLQVIVNRVNLPFTFGRVIGLSTYKVAAVATAYQGPTVGSTHIFPLAVQCTAPCSTINLQPADNVPFGTKFSPTGNASANWQWWNVGNGSSALGDAITNGEGPFSVGDNITTDPGNKGSSGGVTTAWNNLMGTCPSLGFDPCTTGQTQKIPDTDPCMVTVPAVDYNNCVNTKTGGLLNCGIEAFAQVYLEPSSTSTNITACFVQQYDPNAIGSSPGAPDLGSHGPVALIQ